MNGPLDGIKVLDVSAVVAGPWASSQMADMGAEVIMIERVDAADTMRLTGPTVGDQSGCWVSMHRSKQAMALNLRDPRALDILKQLAAEADIFLQNYRPGVADRLGIGYEDLKAINPDLVYVSVSGFGPDGPYAKQPVYDPLIQAMSGLASAQGGDFVKSIVVDKVTAMTVCNAALAALVGRGNGAGGQHIQISLLEALMAWMWPDVYWNEALPDAPPIPSYSIWYSPYDTADGQVAAVWVSYKQFQAACIAVGRPEVANDERFATREGRLAHSLEMRAEFSVALADMTTEAVLDGLRSADVPCAPVLSREEAMADPQVEHMKILIESDHPTAGKTVTVRPPATFSGTPATIRSHAPGRGENTDEILRGLGLDDATVAELREQGIVL